MSSSIERELARCRESAEEGYALASAKYSDIENTLLDAQNSLSKTDAEQQVSRLKNDELVANQQANLDELKRRIGYIGGDLQNLRGRMKDFSIVVYGRTMAGKSTLMEILKHGNGQSIGKGAQRTTLDVRDYFWNGLKITDVPGISAFSADAKDARVDETLALEAAKKADLILFLLTSDAPQPDEAEKLAQLRSLGKPVLGVINVKMSFNINDDLDIEDLQDKMSDNRTINDTINQFKQFARNHNQDWSGIKFVATHLLSAYLAQDKNSKVFRISRFSEVEDFILDKVRNDGRFLRIKTFADAVAVPMSNVIPKIYKFSENSLRQSRVYLDKRRQLIEWRGKFLARSQERLDNLYNQLSEELDREISDFSYYHYEDEHAGEHWQQRFQRLNFDEKYGELLQTLADECERKRKELSDELTQELRYTLNSNTRTNIQLDSTTAWGQNISKALPLLALLPGVGWIGAGVIGAVSLLGNLFFDSKEKKRAQNREKLRDAITPPSYDVLGKMHDKVIEIFNDKILKAVDELYDLLAGYQLMFARLGDSQSDMARALFDEFSDLNFKLLVEANNYKNVGSGNLHEIPRIPGEKMIILADSSSLDTRKLSDLLGENVSVMEPGAEFLDTVKKVLHCDFEIDSYPLDFGDNPKHAYALLPKSKVDATAFKLAQQIAGVPIIAEFTQPQRVTQSTRRNNQSQGSSGGRTQTFQPPTSNSNTSTDFNAEFYKLDDMIADGDDDYSIKNKLIELEYKARNLRNAVAMHKVADYYQQISDYQKAFSCRDEAKSFQSPTSSGGRTQTFQPKSSSGGRTQTFQPPTSSGNAFDSDFAELDELLNYDEDLYNIRTKLMFIRRKAENQRDAAAMNKLASYYKELGEYIQAEKCSELAKTYAR